MRWPWILWFCSCAAERPGRSSSYALGPEDPEDPLSDPALRELLDVEDAVDTSRCPQASAARSVLQKMGLPEAELKILHSVEAKYVRWRGCKLTTISLRGRPDVKGVLSDELLQLEDLLWVSLRGTNVAGDLAMFRKAVKMKDLVLDHTRIQGDLGVLQNLTSLRRLHLKGTDVHGDLKDVGRALELFDLGETKVSGNVAALSAASKLKKVLLKSTQVFGDVKALSTLTELRKLDLLDTKVSGDISVTINWPLALFLDFSGTNVTGRLDSSWRRCCKRLRSLKLANTQVKFVPLVHVKSPQWLPALTKLDLSGSPLNCTVGDLLVRSLRLSGSLANLKAARCGLRGSVPQMGNSKLARSLAVLDLEGNQLTFVRALAPTCQTLNLAGNQKLSFANGVIRKALADSVFLDLHNATFANQSEVKDLLETLKIGDYRSLTNEERGFGCFDLDNSQTIRVSPDQFAPDELCSCLPGWKGSGTKCQKCPRNSFKEDYGGDCLPCPSNSSSPEGARSHESCRCDVGVLFFLDGAWRCGCPKDYAQLGKSCVKCDELHLDCGLPGSEAHSAGPLPGFTRLGDVPQAFKCLPPETRCAPEAGGNCRPGYSGPLCMDCESKYYATGRLCEPCNDTSIAPWVWILVLLAVLAVAALGGWWLWAKATTQPETPTAVKALKEQIWAQAPLLLQMCQLWAVLAVLNHLEVSPDGSKFSEVPYVQALQLSLSNLKSLLQLQCNHDAALVRFVLALSAPVIPLLVLLCCCVVELWRRGVGIKLGLQALTLLYIGGARSCSDLLSCQETDGAGDALPTGSAFRRAMPYISCTDDSQMKRSVDAVGYLSACCYGVLIPCCLLYLYARQHMALQSSRIIGAACAQKGDLKICLYQVRGSNTAPLQSEESAVARRLLAAATANVAVLLRGPVELRLEEGVAWAKPLERGSGGADLWDFLGDINERTTTLKCRNIMEMLTERCILQEAEQSDRVLSGAQNLLLKYTLCGNVWMEIVQKLVAVGLVSVVGSLDALQLTLAITLSMAAICGMVQPYLLPQLNTLQCCCFSCLALAALSFDFGWQQLSRLALAVPFLVSLGLAVVTPDSPERLATRLWQELEPQLGQLQKGQSVEVNAEILSFF